MATTPTWTSFTTTPIFGHPAIRFSEVEIPLHITKMSTQDEGSVVSEITYGPLIDTTSNLGSGGTTVGYGANKLPKINLEGFIDSPMTTTIVDYSTPTIVRDGYHITYGEILAAYFEGRISTNSTSGFWTQTSPTWFRDGYGRVYGNAAPTGPNRYIRIWDLTLQRVEAVPTRVNFTMVLQV